MIFRSCSFLAVFALASVSEAFSVSRHEYASTLLRMSNTEDNSNKDDPQQQQKQQQSSRSRSGNKSPDRAHIERNLEDMMQNDWREFRAKLVHQEQSLGGVPIAPAPLDTTSAASNNSKNRDSSLAKQGQLGELFAGAISSIFEKSSKKKQKQQQQEAAATTNNIFDGDTVGTPTTTTSSSNTNDLLLQSHEDPFVSAAEIPLLLRETKIDKHRWAHPIPHVEPGCVLLANEKLGGVFQQTVVLIVQHCEQSGSIGIVINRPLNGDLLHVASQNEESKLDLSLKLAFSSSPVTYGGPVLPDEFSILHGFGEVDGATKLIQGVYVGGSEALMDQVRIQRLDPRQALFVQGHAAWVPGQLSKEINKGVWYTAAASTDFVLRYAGAKVTPEDNTDDLWADILTCMGGEYAAMVKGQQQQAKVQGGGSGGKSSEEETSSSSMP